MSSIAPSLAPPKSTEEIRNIQSERKRHAVAQARRAAFFKGKLDHVNVERLDDPEAAGAALAQVDRDEHVSEHGISAYPLAHQRRGPASRRGSLRAFPDMRTSRPSPAALTSEVCSLL